MFSRNPSISASKIKNIKEIFIMYALFQGLSLIIQRQVKARDDYRQRIANWNKQTNVYTQEALSARKSEEFPAYAAQTRENVSALEKNLSDMEQKVLARETKWESGSSEKLSNFLRIIELNRGRLNTLAFSALREAFRGDITTITTLKQVLENYVPSALDSGKGGAALDSQIIALDNMIYEPAVAFKSLERSAKEAFYNGLNLNPLIHEANKVARLENVSEISFVDHTGNQHDIDVAFGSLVEYEPVHPDASAIQSLEDIKDPDSVNKELDAIFKA
jgi:hypothetical protein